MKVHVPQHLEPGWLGEELSRRVNERPRGGKRPVTTYIKPKKISIRQYIALAEKLEKL